MRSIAAGICISLGLMVASTTGLAQVRPSAPSIPAFNQAQWNRIVEAARKEAEVTIYTTNTPDQLNLVKSGFEKKYPGIVMSFFRATQPAMESKIEVERSTGAPGADLITFPWDPWFEKTLREGGFSPPIGPATAEWKGNIHFKGDYVTTNFYVLGLAWNTNLVRTPIHSHADLLKPEFANGKVGIAESPTPVYVEFYSHLEDQNGADYLNRLAAQKPKFFPSAVPIMQQLAAGEIAVANFSTTAVLDLKAKGAPVDFVIPPNPWTLRTYSAVLKWGKHPNAALLLLDYMMSRDGQESLARGGASALKGISASIADPEQFQAQRVDRLTPQYIDEYTARWKKIFNR